VGEAAVKPALGESGGPAFGVRTGAKVDLHVGKWKDGRWSYLYDKDTSYAPQLPAGDEVAAAARSARGGELPEDAVVQGPIINAPVWTWEVPLYFWSGGIAAGSAFVAFACDLAGDGESAATARKVALAALGPSPVLLILDLGRSARFYNMLRIFKPRSPMSMGAWALTVFGNLAAAAVGADLLGRKREARALGAANAVVGGYLGSYAGVLLASTAVPAWARSRLFLGPIFVTTATATGAAACRLALSATGLEPGHPTRRVLGRVETTAMVIEMGLSVINERRLGPLAEALGRGRPGRLFGAAKWAVRGGLALRAAKALPGAQHVSSALFLAAGLLFRYAWVEAGPASARDDRAVAAMHRTERHGH
jgi:Polysulphide reductase, NrfD